MAALHIEHSITDLETWLGAFNRFADARRDAASPRNASTSLDDDTYIVLQLDFETTDAAEKFKEFLESVVGSLRDLSPGLEGTPTARVLREVEPTA